MTECAYPLRAGLVFGNGRWQGVRSQYLVYLVNLCYVVRRRWAHVRAELGERPQKVHTWWPLRGRFATTDKVVFVLATGRSHSQRRPPIISHRGNKQGRRGRRGKEEVAQRSPNRIILSDDWEEEEMEPAGGGGYCALAGWLAGCCEKEFVGAAPPVIMLAR
jgi:hypothetical protein